MKRRLNKRAVLMTVLSAVLLMGTLTACEKKLVMPSNTKTTASAGASTEQASASKSEEAVQEQEVKELEKKEVTGTPVTLNYFSMILPDGWTMNEEKQRDDDYKSVVVMDIMEGDQSIVNLEVRVSDNDCSSYRGMLKLNDIDAYEMVENRAYPMLNIGGVETVIADVDGSKVYLGRDEKSNVTVDITAKGDTADPRIEEALSTIEYNYADTGHIDPPWPWRGERFTTDKEHSVMLEDKTITAQYLPMDEPLLIDDIFSGKIEVVGDSLFTLTDSKLNEYALGETLTFKRAIELPEGKYEELSSDVNGNLYVSGLIVPMLTIKDGQIIASNDGTKTAVIDKSGTFGISYFVGKVPLKVTLSDNIASTGEWAFIDEKKVTEAGFTRDSMYVAGKTPETDYMTLWIFDKEGNLKLTFGNVDFKEEGSIGSIVDVIETDAGIIGVDGNSKKLHLWKHDGTRIGEAKIRELTGTSSCWPSTATMGDDGSYYIAVEQMRDDESANEFLVYKLSGF